MPSPTLNSQEPQTPGLFEQTRRANRSRSLSGSNIYLSNNSQTSLRPLNDRQRKSIENLRSSSANLIRNEPLTGSSSSASGGAIPKSFSQKALAGLKRFGDSSSNLKAEWSDTEQFFLRKQSEDMLGRPKSSNTHYSPISFATEHLSDVPPLRVSSDATTASTSSSSPVKVAFDLPQIVFPNSDHPEATPPLSSFIELSSESALPEPFPQPHTRTERKHSLSIFAPFTSLFPDGSSTSVNKPNASPSNGQLPTAKSKTVPLHNVSQHTLVSQDPQLSSAPRKAPLYRLRRKTVSMLFNNDADLGETSKETPTTSPGPSGLDFEVAFPKYLSPSDPLSPSLPLPGSQSPPPLVRSYSNQGTPSGEDAETQDESKEPTVGQPTRPRSKTFSSIEPKINYSHPFAKQSMGGFFSSKRSDSEPSIFALPQQPTPSPSRSIILKDAPSLELPQKDPDDSPESYLAKVNQVGLGTYTAAALSEREGDFYKVVLRTYIESFSFEDYPLDMALRKFLILVSLPKETQQIDRVLEAFAYRYYNCNPLIYLSVENAYIVVFSLVMLHTDFFNKNNKYKMQRFDYIKNTAKSADVSPDILGVSICDSRNQKNDIC